MRLNRSQLTNKTGSICFLGKTHSLFNTDDTNLFPLISCDRLMPDQPALPAYINGLLFKDQVSRFYELEARTP